MGGHKMSQQQQGRLLLPSPNDNLGRHSASPAGLGATLGFLSASTVCIYFPALLRAQQHPKTEVDPRSIARVPALGALQHCDVVAMSTLKTGERTCVPIGV